MAVAAPRCDPLGRIIEFDQYIAADGLVYDLHAPTVRSVLSDQGLGMPPMEYVTERGPYQHGVTIKDYVLRPRVVQMSLRQSFGSRTAYWQGLGDLYSAIKPNRTVGWIPGVTTTPPGQGRLRKYMPNGSFLDLNVMIAEGPKLAADTSGSWDQWGFSETIRFIANDPLLFDPVQKSAVFASPTQQLVFPATFPVTFSKLDSSISVTYDGNWDEFPTIVLTGALTNPAIYNHTTGESIVFDYALAAGRVLTLTLPYGNKRAILDDGTEVLSGLQEPNDLSTFHLACDPVAPGGINQLQVTGQGISATSSVSMSWFSRYIALQQI